MKKSSKKFKQMQRERIARTKPWVKSTGPKTLEGKQRSKMNALKISPVLHSLIKEYKQLMIEQKEISNIINHTKTL